MANNISPPKFLLAGLIPRYQTAEKTLAIFEELQSLVTTYGGIVVDATTQNFSKAQSATYFGKGKIQEIAQKITHHQVDTLVINDSLKADQLFRLTEIFKVDSPRIQVWDRINLILNIFDKHATSIEAKLQIKLARYRHRGPELQGIGLTLSQQGGGIGTRGLGETTTEMIKRHWKEEIRAIQKDIDKGTKNRLQQMAHRKRSGIKTVSIVGYTNAGKSTLFERLTHKSTYIKDELFATLDSLVGTGYLPQLQKEIFVTDTIGFIQNLPPDLIDAFSSTLLETVHADLILHIIDYSDPWLTDKITAVETILSALTKDAIPRIYVFNKLDLAKNPDINSLTQTYQAFSPQFISAKNDRGTDSLITAITHALYPQNPQPKPLT